MSNRPIICYLEPLSDSEVESINKYWNVDPDSTNGFACTLKEIDSQKAEGCGPVSGLVKKSCCLVPCSPVFYCEDCQSASPVMSRAQYTKRLKLDSFECEECSERRLNALKEESVSLLTSYLDGKLNQKDYFKDLSYLDCVYLLATLSDDYQENKPVFSAEKRIDLTGAEHLDKVALSRLIEIGALVNLQELPEEIASAEKTLYENANDRVFRGRGRDTYNLYKSPLAIERGIYFSLPPQFSNYIEFYTAIYQRVTLSGITRKECDELKRLVINMRVENLYRLIESISSEFSLEIKKSNPLSALLLHLSESYPIINCYYTFSFYAFDVIKYIRNNNTEFYAQCHLFTKRVSRYIENLEANGWELKKNRKLPDAICTSSVEALVSQHFIDGHFNWNSLTANEVVERWLSSIDIQDAPAAIPVPTA